MPETSSLLLLVNLLATAYMTGVIWFVQIVHYPLMARVDRDSFPAFEDAHTHRTGPVVGPPMFVEIISAVGLVIIRPAQLSVYEPWIGLGLVVLLFASTALIQVPLHRRLTQGFDTVAHERLVRSNWMRTLLWSARMLLVASWVLR